MIKEIRFLAVLLAFVILGSCSSPEEHSDYVSGLTSSKISNPYAFIGSIHNEAMDSVIAQRISLSNLKSFNRDFTNKKLSKTKGFDDVKISTEALNAGYDIGLKMKQVKTRATIDNLTDSLICCIPEEGRPYVSKMFQICDKQMRDTIEINKIFDNIDSNIYYDVNLNDTLRSALFAISSIARATNIYNSKPLSTRGATWGSTAKADLGGAIAGLGWRALFKASYRGFMFGPGGIVLSFAQDCAVGAISSSALHVISRGYF